MQKTEEEPTLTAILGGNKPPYAQLQTGKKLSYFTISIRLNLSGTQRCPHSNRWEYLGWLGESKVRGFQREIEREREEEEEEERVVVSLFVFFILSWRCRALLSPTSFTAYQHLRSQPSLTSPPSSDHSLWAGPWAQAMPIGLNHGPHDFLIRL